MVWIVLTAMVLSIELAFAAAALLSLMPFNIDADFVHSIVWHYQRNFQPQRNLLLYFLWGSMATVVYGFMVWLIKFSPFKARWDLKPFFVFHLITAALMTHAGFEILAVGNPVWAWPVFWCAFALALSATVFWTECLAAVSFLKLLPARLNLDPGWGSLLGCLLIFLVIFMPDLQAVVAMVYMGDYFHNWDASLFGGVYAVYHGAIPFIDVNITYGLGASVMLAKVLHLLGGFDYSRILGISMWIEIIYFIAWFLLLKRFYASGLLAFAAVIMAIRMQMFNNMVEPCIWVEILHSAFRVCFDAGVFWMIWMHLQTRRAVYLTAGAVFASLGIFHMLQTGTYAFLVFALYVVLSAFVPCLGGKKDFVLWRRHALVLTGVFLLSGLWFFMSVGPHVFAASFYKNLTGYSSYFVKGAFEGPLSAPFSGVNLGSAIGGFFYPVFCLGVFLYAAGQVVLGSAGKRGIFAGLLALYGLESHSYYMLMVTQWFTLALPGLFVLYYLAGRGLEKIPKRLARGMVWALAFVSVYCLVTSRHYPGYPNLLNFSRNPIVDERVAFRVGPRQVPYFHQLMADFPEAFKLPLNNLDQKEEGLKFEKDFADQKELKDYYAQATSWPEDVQLIRRLTPEGGSAAVFGSFEILLLQRADRKPFFYYFPLINSRPLTVRNFMVTCLFCYPQVQQILDQLENQKPEYVFMERIFLTPQIPQAYLYEYDDMISILRYILAKYQPYEAGKYFIAMKRRP